MPQKFTRISDLANGAVFVRRGEAAFAVQRPYPVPEFSPLFRKFRLPFPMRLWEVSHRLYGDSGLRWGLIAEWNKIPNPTQWNHTYYLPQQFEIRYLTDDVLFELIRRARRINLSGAGEVDLDVSLSAPVVPTAQDALRVVLTRHERSLEEASVDFQVS